MFLNMIFVSIYLKNRNIVIVLSLKAAKITNLIDKILQKKVLKI